MQISYLIAIALLFAEDVSAYRTINHGYPFPVRYEPALKKKRTFLQKAAANKYKIAGTTAALVGTAVLANHLRKKGALRRQAQMAAASKPSTPDTTTGLDGDVTVEQQKQAQTSATGDKTNVVEEKRDALTEQAEKEKAKAEEEAKKAAESTKKATKKAAALKKEEAKEIGSDVKAGAEATGQEAAAQVNQLTSEAKETSQDLKQKGSEFVSQAAEEVEETAKDVKESTAPQNV